MHENRKTGKVLTKTRMKNKQTNKTCTLFSIYFVLNIPIYSVFSIKTNLL